jgi:hypothetical protein
VARRAVVLPNATEAVWTLAEDRSVYVEEHADGAGNSVVTIFVDDLDAHVAAAAARGLEPDDRLTYSNGVRKAHRTATKCGSAERRSTPLHSATGSAAVTVRRSPSGRSPLARAARRPRQAGR